MQQRSMAITCGRSGLLCLACLGVSLTPARLSAQQGLPPLPVYRGTRVALAGIDLAAVGRGEPAIQMLDGGDPRVVAVFGLVAIAVPRSFFAARVGDFVESLHSNGRGQHGLFALPATPADAASLALSPADLSGLRKCRPGSCEFKIPASEMSRVATILDSAGPGGPSEVSRYARKRAADLVNEYRERGNAAMTVYDDFGTTGVKGSEAFSALLLAAQPYLSQVGAPLQEYLSSYPRKRPEGAKDAIFWMREDVQGMRPTVSINHLIVYSASSRPQATVAVTKQVFADHYFEGALDVYVASARTDVPRGEGVYLILLRQYRFDHLPAGIINVRGRVRTKVRERAEADLRRLRAEYQAAWTSRKP